MEGSTVFKPKKSTAELKRKVRHEDADDPEQPTKKKKRQAKARKVAKQILHHLLHHQARKVAKQTLRLKKCWMTTPQLIARKCGWTMCCVPSPMSSMKLGSTSLQKVSGVPSLRPCNHFSGRFEWLCLGLRDLRWGRCPGVDEARRAQQASSVWPGPRVRACVC